MISPASGPTPTRRCEKSCAPATPSTPGPTTHSPRCRSAGQNGNTDTQRCIATPPQQPCNAVSRVFEVTASCHWSCCVAIEPCNAARELESFQRAQERNQIAQFLPGHLRLQT